MQRKTNKEWNGLLTDAKVRIFCEGNKSLKKISQFFDTTIVNVKNLGDFLNILPSSIYSWSIGHILEHEFFCLGCLGSKDSKGNKWI